MPEHTPTPDTHCFSGDLKSFIKRSRKFTPELPQRLLRHVTSSETSILMKRKNCFDMFHYKKKKYIYIIIIRGSYSTPQWVHEFGLSARSMVIMLFDAK